jgi:hypothetical protein
MRIFFVIEKAIAAIVGTAFPAHPALKDKYDFRRTKLTPSSTYGRRGFPKTGPPNATAKE